MFVREVQWASDRVPSTPMQCACFQSMRCLDMPTSGKWTAARRAITHLLGYYQSWNQTRVVPRVDPLFARARNSRSRAEKHRERVEKCASVREVASRR